MGNKLKEILKDMASVLVLFPPPPPIAPMSADERLWRAWERTEQVLQRAIDRYASDHTSR